MTTPLSRRIGWILVGASLLLQVFTVACFAWQPDRFAALTVVPIWLWGGLGLFLTTIAFCFLRASFSRVMTVIWLATILLGSDEARVLTHWGKAPPKPGVPENFQGKPVLRVITLNCAVGSHGNPAQDLAVWQPDIVLLQEALPYQVRQITDALYGGHGDFRTHRTNAIVTRWKIQREMGNPTLRDHEATIVTPTGALIEIVNVHLTTAATDLRFWSPSAWHDHRTNRSLRKQELTATQQLLKNSTDIQKTATIFGGDFNAPSADIVHRFLNHDFVDCFATAGSGWGDTFQRHFPILRIDHLYVIPFSLMK